MIETTCSYCGTDFAVQPSVLAIGNGKFCSRECSLRFRRGIPLESGYIPKSQRGICTCQNCGQKFRLHISKIAAGRGRYCSRKCRLEGKSKKQTIIQCQHCQTEFQPKSGKGGKYCSKKCFYAARKKGSSTERICKHCGKKLARYAIRDGFHLKCLRIDQDNDVYGLRDVPMVNGVQVSKPQRQLCEMLDGKLNYPCGSYKIDVALLNKMIAVEYDCWFWHGDRQEHDLQRDNDLLAAGWKILHVKTNKLFPSQQEIEDAIAQLEAGKSKIEVELDDWGKGMTLADTKKTSV